MFLPGKAEYYSVYHMETELMTSREIIDGPLLPVKLSLCCALHKIISQP
jgi:hypothetical protein